MIKCMLLLFDYSGPCERYLSSFRLTFLVRTTTTKGNVERTMSTTAAAPRKYHKVCFYTASATAAIQLDFLCAAAVIICIIYRPKTHHNIINHITSLPVNIIYTCVCEYVAPPESVFGSTWWKKLVGNDFFLLVRTAND